MEVDESLLTGESEPVVKAPGDDVLSGSFIAAGPGRYRATKVGEEAYAVQLAQDARRFTLTRSELRSGIDRILTYVTFAIIPTAVLLFISQLRASDDWREAVSGAVAGVVAMVPEGLVLLTSLAFAVAVRPARAPTRPGAGTSRRRRARARRRALLDKTGTLTQGKLAVEAVEPLTGQDDETATDALAAIAAGDAAPNATMLAIRDRFDQAPDWTTDATVPFSSARKWSGASFDGHGAWLLGAPDVLMGTTRGNDEVHERVGVLSDDGKRVVLLASAERLAPTSCRRPSSRWRS